MGAVSERAGGDACSHPASGRRLEGGSDARTVHGVSDIRVSPDRPGYRRWRPVPRGFLTVRCIGGGKTRPAVALKLSGSGLNLWSRATSFVAIA